MRITESARTAAVGIVRHRGASIVAVVTLAFMLTALTIFVLLANGLGSAASRLEAKANLIADLNGNISHSAATSIGSNVQARWPQVQVTYASKTQALTQFRKTFAGDSAMLSAVEGNPLPASLQFRSADPRLLTGISSFLRSDSSVKRVIYNPNLTHKLVAIATFVNVAGIILVLGLAFLALVIVVNTTHLTVEARRDEIEIMKLIGATHAFVRNPLLFEGIFLGLGGALTASMVGMGVFLPILKGLLASSAGFGVLLPIDTNLSFIAALSGSVLVVGATVGAAGSYISVRKFAGV